MNIFIPSQPFRDVRSQNVGIWVPFLPLRKEVVQSQFYEYMFFFKGLHPYDWDYLGFIIKHKVYVSRIRIVCL